MLALQTFVFHVPVNSFHEELLHNLPKDRGAADWPVVPFPVLLVNSQELTIKGYKILR